MSAQCLTLFGSNTFISEQGASRTKTLCKKHIHKLFRHENLCQAFTCVNLTIQKTTGSITDFDIRLIIDLLLINYEIASQIPIYQRHDPEPLRRINLRNHSISRYQRLKAGEQVNSGFAVGLQIARFNGRP